MGVTVLVENYPAESEGCSPMLMHAQSKTEQPWGCSDRRNSWGSPLPFLEFNMYLFWGFVPEDWFSG